VRKQTRKSVGGTRAANHVERIRLERLILLYVERCSGGRTPARVSELADFIGTNRSYLSRNARPILGRTLRSALVEQQLINAERLLRTTIFSIAEVAVLAAFGTPTTFYRTFRKAFGCSPGEYRRRVTNCE
jgi:AraC-like DNA-binding protein